jgi:hypothetical protein
VPLPCAQGRERDGPAVPRAVVLRESAAHEERAGVAVWNKDIEGQAKRDRQQPYAKNK